MDSSDLGSGGGAGDSGVVQIVTVAIAARIHLGYLLTYRVFNAY